MRTTDKQYMCYLAFMLAACGGAFVWQFCLPGLAEEFSAWGTSAGWQREIALWNVGLMAALVLALCRRDRRLMKLAAVQCDLLCWLLGLNHLAAFLRDPSAGHVIHILGIVEVLLAGGLWGGVLLIRDRDKPAGNS